ncbi:hypothetical protein [Desulfoluna spongiiphila]|uniref:hypothetical protein n=1 Tax=Desulfoluna spongiiphila TaxID=419481 RepID=UPI00125234B3|nr:hypothetical protein [Desulfoluna spongiiphila]VVS95167.1 hypothetical protein DBB_47440 [Desulfoluna spongiiphila]
MKTPRPTTLALIAFGLLLTAGSAFAEPLALSEGAMDTISGQSGIEDGHALLEIAERDTEVKREILRRNNTTEYPVESSHERLTQFANIQNGKLSGQTIHQLLDEGTPGRLPQFFIDAAQLVVGP